MEAIAEVKVAALCFQVRLHTRPNRTCREHVAVLYDGRIKAFT